MSKEIDPTRKRLLEAAGETFAEKGFRGATVREICEGAGANIAAVNYHFRDKEGLYGEVLRYAHRCVASQTPEEAVAGMTALPPRQKLLEFIRLFLQHILAEGRPAWAGKLMAREMIDPTFALDQIVQEEIRPRSMLLRQILREVAGPTPSDEQIVLCVISVIAQMVFHHHAREVIQRMQSPVSYDAAGLEALAQHVWRFSLAALENYGEAGAP
jgi:AcrR family transcriptional regulator